MNDNKQHPKSYDYTVKKFEIPKDAIKAHENNFVHVEFSLEFESDREIQPTQVAVRLAHPQYPTATN